MQRLSRRLLGATLLLLGVGFSALGSTSAPIQLAPAGDTLWVVNPDSDSVARIDTATGTRTGEFPVGRHPRTVALTVDGTVFVTNQRDDTVSRLLADGSPAGTIALPFGCAPYGIAASGPTPTSLVEELYVSCQGTSTLVVLRPADDTVSRTVPLAWAEARGVAVARGGLVYVSHFITKEPNHDGHVSEIDPSTSAVARVFAIPPDFSTCETIGSGQGVANLLDAVAVPPPGAPPDVIGELWVGGTLHNALRKGLFQRSRFFQGMPGAGLFPALDFQSNPAGEGELARRNLYKPGLHDVARSVIWRIDLASGESRGRLDVANGGGIAGLTFSADGRTAYAVDLMANGFYAFATGRGASGNAASLFGPVAARGPGGATPGSACTANANDVVAEDPFILAPQARLVPTGGMNPLDAVTLMPVDTGLDYTVGLGTMRGVPDGVGTTPIGLALAVDGSVAYVANYLARNVAVVTARDFRCQTSPATACTTRLDCAGGSECMPLVADVIASTMSDPVLPEILDGKILFATAARDAAGQQSPIPPWNDLTTDGTTLQGEVVSTARDGGSLACISCHPDFGGQDGRTWDFAQFGSSLRNTMDLRGRASFAPGTCSHDGSLACTTDAECRSAGGAGVRCTANPVFVPPNILAAEDRATFFNPMGTTHWNGDRDEVEDFEFTFRELLGASDCDGNEHSPETCVGALVVRRFVADPVDVRVDLSPQPNRHRSQRLDDLADFVYSLTEFPQNPNLGAGGTSPSAAAVRGRALFNDPVVQCGFCHSSAPPSPQQFSDKKPNTDYDTTQTPRADLNNPFFTHDVGTTNVFDETNPFRVASDQDGLLGFTLFQNEQNQIPGNRNTLNTYITSVLTDVWNTAPYLHDGSAATLLDVVRPCGSRFGVCKVAGRGRNVDDLHGRTSFLSARQLNDLVAFQKAPHPPVVEKVAIRGTALDVRKLRVRFGRKPGRDTLALVASASVGADQTIDPASDPVAVSLGVPDGEQMAIVEWVFAPGELQGRGGRFRFKDRKGTRKSGLRGLTLAIKHGKLALRVAARTDLTWLRGKSLDYTIALEVGDDVSGVTRLFKTNRKGTIVKGP